MFVQGATPGRVDGWSYHEDDEDFTKGTFIPALRISRLKFLF
jgi:phosphatidylinositol glycan class N